MTLTLETNKLQKSFGDFVAVDCLDLAIHSGEIFGLLGPNAAGKSTTIRILAGILQADSGEASILGLNLFSQAEIIKKRIGYVAQQFSLYSDLTVYENISFYAGLYGVDDEQRIQDLLNIYGLTLFKDKRAGLLSGGYKRRLAIACATAHDPELIFLDEPTAGIDPVTRKELWDLFYSLSTKGKTLFVTTHYMEEAERCHRLAFMSNGKVVAQGTPSEIRDSLKDRRVYASQIAHDPVLVSALMKMPEIKLVNQFGSELRIITDVSVSAEQLHKMIAGYYKPAFQLSAVSPSIEDAFISLTSNGDAS